MRAAFLFLLQVAGAGRARLPRAGRKLGVTDRQILLGVEQGCQVPTIFKFCPEISVPAIGVSDTLF